MGFGYFVESSIVYVAIRADIHFQTVKQVKELQSFRCRYQLALGTLSHCCIIIAVLHIKLLVFSGFWDPTAVSSYLLMTVF